MARFLSSSSDIAKVLIFHQSCKFSAQIDTQKSTLWDSGVSVFQISVLLGVIFLQLTVDSFIGDRCLISANQISVFYLGGTDGRWQFSHEHEKTAAKNFIIYIIYILYI